MNVCGQDDYVSKPLSRTSWLTCWKNETLCRKKNND